MKRKLIATALAAQLQALGVLAPGLTHAEVEYSPYANQDFPKQVYFGDTHLHTSYSVDAGMIGNTLGPADAFRFAKGETVTSSMGVPARLVKPLDFLVIADHAEGLGVAPMISRSDPSILSDPFGKQLHELVMQGTAESAGKAFNLFNVSRKAGTNTLLKNADFAIEPWEEIIDAAEAANAPGQFTSLIGFEFTSAPAGANLHRVVIYRDGKEVAVQHIPLSSDIDPDPEALWSWMEDVENKTGGKLLAIAHNGNLSAGKMFDDVRFTSGKPIDRSYAQRRQRFEPLYEVTQMKGDGEAHPALSPDDDFADFETWDRGGWSIQREPVTPDMFPREYARPALKRGLAYEAKLGVNPFKFGMIGSTDAHTSLATSREENFFGKVSQLEPSAEPTRFRELIGGRIVEGSPKTYAWQTSASGLAAVWSHENSRESIWDAMQRKEVYATSGTRITVRVFAGYDFSSEDLPRSDFAQYGYSKGVPMGGDLAAARGGQTPGFLIRALRDPDGANLDRVQVVKGWLDSDGTTAEKVYDVAWSGDRKPGSDSKIPAVGNSVDAAAATYQNDIGSDSLAKFWEDPDFNPQQQAFYYVRVLEIPTPRWTTYDAKTFGVKIPEGAPVAIQERAYTSPIWYTP